MTAGTISFLYGVESTKTIRYDLDRHLFQGVPYRFFYLPSVGKRNSAYNFEDLTV